MMDRTSLKIGVNLGGWISQYPAYDHQHFKTFISADDIKRIADWGMDHVRLPVDYPVLEQDDHPGVYLQSGFDYIESCLEWCRKNGLRVILDLHKAPGFAFDALDKNSLFQSPVMQERFLGLWEAISERFLGGLDDSLAFELLNEIVLPDSGPWNDLVQRVLARIRSVDPQRLVLVGGNRYNAADELQNLAPIADPNILYTFHFYLPLSITHQKAPWIRPLKEYDQQLEYPGWQAPGLAAIVEKYPSDTHALKKEVGQQFNKDYLRSVLQPALDFSHRLGQPVYCGEFGVYEAASMATRLNWTRDFTALLEGSHIGRAYWTYKDLDFGLVDKAGRVVDQGLVDLASGVGG
jgi:aryl-phospho-beta-D-glucosidase BglC (GH1 family)